MAPPSKNIDWIVQMIDRVMLVNGPLTMKGRDLMEEILRRLNIAEKHWFGLYYENVQNQKIWLSPEEKVTWKDVRPFPNTNAHLKLQIQYFPEHFETEVVQDSVKVFIFKQETMRSVTDPEVQILASDRIAVAVAFVCLRVHESMYTRDPEEVLGSCFDILFPPHILSRFLISKDEWAASVKEGLKTAQHQYYMDPVIRALQILQHSPMYGTTFYNVVNKQKTPLALGVDAQGISFYRVDNKLSPLTTFSWDELRSVSYKKNQFSITLMKTSIPPVVFTAESLNVCDEMLKMVAGTHQSYLMRTHRSKAFEAEIQAAKAIQTQIDKKRQAFEHEREEMKCYENNLQRLFASKYIDDQSLAKPEEYFNKVKNLLIDRRNNIIQSAEENKKAEQKNKTNPELEVKERQIEMDLTQKQKANPDIGFMNDVCLDPLSLEKQAVEAIDRELKELEKKHLEALEKLRLMKQQSPAQGAKISEAQTKAPQAAAGEKQPKEAMETPAAVPEEALTYEEIKTEEEHTFYRKLAAFEESIKNRAHPQSKELEKQNVSLQKLEKFNTLKNLRRCDVASRIDQFDSF